MRQGGMKPKVTALVFTGFVQMQTLAVVVKVRVVREKRKKVVWLVG